MTRAEERALEKYPKLYGGSPYGPLPIELNIKERQLFIEGYEQAEKDLTDQAKFSSGWDGFYYGKGYDQAKKDTIERAVEWLCTHHPFDTKEQAELYAAAFKKAMEKEEE